MKKSELKQLIKEVIRETDDPAQVNPDMPPRELIEKLQNLLNTTNKIFDFALVYKTYAGMTNGYDFEFFNNMDDIDYSTIEGLPVAKVTKTKVVAIKPKK